jgi:hypothetical protein
MLKFAGERLGSSKYPKNCYRPVEDIVCIHWLFYPVGVSRYHIILPKERM